MRDNHDSTPTHRRTSFHRRGDVVAVVAIVVAALTVGVTVWARSDIHNTVSQTGPSSVATPPAPQTVPDSLHEAWHASSTATPVPVALESTVVSAADGAVLGRDPVTGKVRWRYERDLGLCTVGAQWSMVIAVYHRSRNCSEVTALHATTGARGPQRNGDAGRGTRLVGDDTYLTTTGPTLSDTWRSDLVKTTEYGDVPDFKNPDRQPRPECRHENVAAGSERVGVVEHCPDAAGDRITVYKAKSEDSDKPEVLFSKPLETSHARIVAMGAERIALAAPGTLQVRDIAHGRLIASYPIDTASGDLSGTPPGGVTPTSEDPDTVYWYTGSATIALGKPDFRPLWTVRGTLGPGTPFAGELLLPVPDGLSVTDPESGKRLRTIEVDRHGYTGPVAMDTIGPVVLEQRGDTLVALRGS